MKVIIINTLFVNVVEGDETQTVNTIDVPNLDEAIKKVYKMVEL